MNKYSNFIPVRLYIKRHKVTGLLYFGKTKYENIEKYKGSGVIWKDHIKKYGKDIETIWVSEWFYSPYDVEEFATLFSELHDIVNSRDMNGKKIWANLQVEDGLDGGRWIIHTKDAILKQKRTINSDEYKNKHKKLCEYCNREITSPSNFYRWHGENCKLNPNRCSDIDIHNSEIFNKISNSRKTSTKEIFNCMFCGKTIKNKGAYINHHGENCKENKNRTKESIERQNIINNKLSDKAIKRVLVTCEFCGKSITKCKYSQYHGVKCKTNMLENK